MGNGQSGSIFDKNQPANPCYSKECRGKSGADLYWCRYQCNVKTFFSGAAGEAGSIVGGAGGSFFQGIFGDNWPIFVVGGAVVIGGILLIVILK